MHVLASYERVLSETLLGSRSSRPEHTYSLLIAHVSILYRSVSKPCTDFFYVWEEDSVSCTKS